LPVAWSSAETGCNFLAGTAIATAALIPTVLLLLLRQLLHFLLLLLLLLDGRVQIAVAG